MALLHVNFFSETLGMQMQMDVTLPQTKDSEPYPVLYLLHGMSDDHTIWQRRTSIERYVDSKRLAVVMPSTHLGFYTDMAHGLKYFTFIGIELPQICRNFFPRMSAKREDNFIAGLSMGGYGAFKFALSLPETFCAAASLSGALDIRPGKSTIGPLFDNIFGEEFDDKNDLFYLAKNCNPKPKLYMWCGTEDFLYQANVKMKPYLEELGYDLTYEESTGDHQWKYWDEKIQTVLNWLGINNN